MNPSEIMDINSATLSASPHSNPSWDRARELWQAATKGAEAIIELGRILVSLREQYFGLGQGRRSDLPARAPGSQHGWEKEVSIQLNITPRTARRIIEKADALERLMAIADGDSVEWIDSKTKERRLTEPTPEAIKLATQVIPGVVAGLVNPRRAWAGVCGEGNRADVYKQRSDVDYAAVMLRAIRSVKSALRRWPELGPEDRAEVEVAWYDLLDNIPDTWRPSPRKGVRK